MKWFKHISDSLQDPLVIEVVNEFGGFGYMVFFGVLEKYAREFKIAPDWKLKVKLEYFRGVFQEKQTKKIKKVLSFLKETGKWSVNFLGQNGQAHKESVEIYIPKFIELLDETTKKHMRKNSGIVPESFRNPSGITPPPELDLEKEIKNINTPPYPPAGGADGFLPGLIDESEEILSGEPEGQTALEGVPDRCALKQAKPKRRDENVPFDDIVALYHEILPELPTVIELDADRKRKIRARWSDKKERQSLGWWRDYFQCVRDQGFLMGEGDRGFRANLDFLVKKSKMPKVCERQYSSPGTTNPGGNGRTWESVEEHNQRVGDEWLKRKKAELEAKNHATG